MAPPNKKGGLHNKKALKRIGGLGDPMAGLAQYNFQENRKGRVVGLYLKRPGLDIL